MELITERMEYRGEIYSYEKMMLKIIFNEIYEVELLPRCDE